LRLYNSPHLLRFSRVLHGILGRVSLSLFPDLKRGFSSHARFIDEYLTGACVLDIGGGDGLLVSKYSQLGKEVILADISIALLRQAKSLGVHLVLCDAESLPFRTRSFESSLFIGSLHHIRNPLNAMVEARRVSTRSIIWDYARDNRKLSGIAESLWLRVTDSGARILGTVRDWKMMIKKLDGHIVAIEHGLTFQFFLSIVVTWD
jgi:SAM-dependent methyltransferase